MNLIQKKRRERQILHKYLEVLALNVTEFPLEDLDKLSASMERIYKALNPFHDFSLAFGCVILNLLICFVILIKKFLRS